jgi:transcriptional regulator with XRE-family HTH domain
MADDVKIGKAYKNVFEMLRETYPDNPEFSEGAFRTYQKEQIAFHMFLLRNSFGVTQEEMAERMGVSQSKIAKLEDRGDGVKFNDLTAYAKALGLGVLLGFPKIDANLSDLMSWHLKSVEEIMDKLIKLADGDPDISVEILKDFSLETAKMLHDVLPKCSAMLTNAASLISSENSVENTGLQIEIHLEHAEKSNVPVEV